MKASTFCQPALTCYETQGQYVEDITRWREDMNMSCKNNILRTTNVTSGVANSINTGAHIHIIVFTYHKNNRFQKKLIVQNMNI